MNNDFIIHYGTPGMKWGVRKKHDDYKKAHKKKSIRYMSDKELKERNNRLEAEQKYKKLTKKSNKGKLAVEVILKTAGAATVAAGAVYAGKKYLPQLLLGAPKVSGLLKSG